jgi:Uma2 family endonuclease
MNIEQQWEALCNDQQINNLPYRIDLINNEGSLLMVPHSNLHSDCQMEIAFLLKKLLPNGKPSVEFALNTGDRVYSIDVCWRSNEWLKKYPPTNITKVAPEICIEVHSPSNTGSEFIKKKNAYFKSGAIEFWICKNGFMEFWISEDTKAKSSLIIPSFPKTI